ncbi:MAG: hypothetical protein Q4Q22_05830 [Methanosphaera sp.]|nr:hypothetical protein [Methanosphaera sp.]
MNRKLKYCSIFLIFTALLIVASGIATAADVDSDYTEISDNIETPTVSDDTQSIAQTTDNNIESQTTEEVDKTTDTYTTATSKTKELVKDDKNLKGFEYSIGVTLNPNTGRVGDSVTASFSGGSYFGTRAHSYTISIDGTSFQTGSVAPKSGYTITFKVPETSAGDHTINFHVYYSAWNNRGSATFTVLSSAVDTKITEVETVNGEVGNTIVPITITDTNGGALDGSPLINVKDGDTLLLENYAVENGVANVSVPTTRTGDYDLTVEVVTNVYFNGCNATIPVSVSKAPTTLIVDQYAESDYHSINVLYNTLLTGKLLQTSNNNPIKNAEIALKVNKTNVIITTDDEGKFEYKYDVTNLGIGLLSIAYNGDDLYLATEEQWEIFEIKSLESNIILDEDPLSEVNETTTISGTLTDNSNNPVPNAEINLEITGVEDTVTVTTDSEGKFSYDVIYNDVAEITVTASMKNQVLYTAENKTMTFNVVVGPRRTNLTIETGSGTGTNINIRDITPYHNELITNGTLLDIFKEPVADATIKIQINGEDFSQTTDSEGKFSLVYNATEGLTAYNINVQFEGNDAYKPAGEVYTGTFTTEAFDIKVTIDENYPEEILIGDTVTITGSATLQNETLKNNPIVLTIDNTKYTTTTDEEGKYTYDYTVARNGTIPIIANATFSNAAVTLGQSSFFVAKPEVNIDLDEIEDTKVYNDFTLNGKIYIAQNDTPINDQLILKINGESMDLASDEDGNFNYVFTPTEAGTYDIVISYGNVKYDVQNATAQVNVNKRFAHMENDELPIAVIVNDVFAISGSLLDEDNEPIVDAEVIFLINDEEFTNTTDSDGHYEYNYLATKIKDNNQYEVKYDGDNNYVSEKSYIGSFFDVEGTTAYITIDAPDVSLNSPTVITGTVTDKNNKLLEGINVTVNVYTEVIELTTNDKGIYTAAYVLPKIGTYPITATVTDARYSEATATIEANVTKISTTTTIADIKLTEDYQANLTAYVVDSKNKALTSGKVVFKINGKTIKDENGKVIYTKIANGEAVQAYTFTQEQIDQNVSVSAAFSGSTNYGSSQSENAKILTADDHKVTMTLNDITTKAGETITITATVKDFDENMNTGKVVFKINGKTIKDANGKVIYTQVEDGIASCDYTIPESMKTRNYTLTAVFTAANFNRTEANAQLTIEDKQADDSIIVINNNNVDQYITKNGLTDLVSPGVTLDIQGTIDKQHSLVINKPINIISSTKDAVINLHTVAGSLMGEDPGNCFVVNKAGSGSNISSLYLTNTECWIFNTHDVTLHNMTMYVKDARVGSGVGQTAIRYSDNITIDSCFIYTENNGGSTSMALTGTSNVLIKNTTIQGAYGSGQVGNILYLGNRYNTGDKPADFTLGVDANITVVNSTLKGECVGAITVLTYLGSVTNISYINNTINTTGNYGQVDTGSNGAAIGNKFYNTGSLVVRQNCHACGNVVYGSGKITAYANSFIYNNTIGTVTAAGSGVLIENNTITTVDFKASSASYIPDNSIISNNIITGSITSQGPSRTRFNSNITIINNQIGGGISLTYTNTHTIENNTINGSISVTTNAGNTMIRYNTIVTTSQYAVTVANATTTVVDNYLVSNNGNLLGNAAVSDTSRRATIANNTPDASAKTHITFDEIYATVGDTIDIFINVDNDDGASTDGTIYLIVNGETLKDENNETIVLNVEGGTAMLENIAIPIEWLKSGTTITAMYTNGQYTLNASTTPYINKRSATVTITTESLAATAGDTVTLTASVTDDGTGELINGRLTFKLDNVSLEDDNLEFIVVDVVDGIATLEYTLPSDMPAGTYALTAVFENASYQRSVENEALTIE